MALFGWLLSYELWLAVIVGYLFYSYLSTRHLNLPPRPESWPVIGNFYQVAMGKELLYKWCKKMSEKHGPVIRVTFGTQDVVIINGYKSLQDAMVNKGMDFTGRMEWKMASVLTDGYQDVAMASSTHPTFKARRKLLALALKNFTIGDAYEKRVGDSLVQLYRHLDNFARKREAIDPFKYCKYMSYSVIFSILFKKVLDIKDYDFVNLSHLRQAANESLSNMFTISDLLPFSQYLPFDLWDVKFARKVRDETLTFFRINREVSLKNYEKSGVVEDLCQYVLKIKEEGEKEGLNDVTELEILHLISDIFMAGVDTTQTTLRWILLILAANQDVQQKVYDEIMEAIPCDDDRDYVSGLEYKHKMPYSEAVVLETTRYGTVSILGLPHTTLCDTKVDEYDVPKGTAVFVNYWAMSRDENDFPEPEVFRPERFMTEDGKLGPRPRGYVPFGLGRRSCPGETAGRNTIWITFVSLVKRFRILPPEGVELKPRYKEASIMEGAPIDYKIILERR